VIYCEATASARQETCDRVAKEQGYHIVHPHNDEDVMSGQGTVALELLEQVPDLDAIIVSIGGGGLTGGMVVCTKAKNPRVKVFCTEPVGKEFQRQLNNGEAEDKHGTLLDTIADGIRINQVAPKCFPPILASVERVVFTVTDDEIRSATKLIMQRLKQVVETSAALPWRRC